MGKDKAKHVAVFPAVLQIDQRYIFRRNGPIIFGCDVLDGQLRLGTPICVPEKDFLEIGHVASIEINGKPVRIGKKGEKVSVKLEQNTSQEHITYGRQFDHKNKLCSNISPVSVNALKKHFEEDVKRRLDCSQWYAITVQNC